MPEIKNIKKIIRQRVAGRVVYDANVKMVHLDKDGNVRPIFQESKLGIWLIKKGWVSPKWINGQYRPLLSPFMGYWALAKDGSNLVTDAGRAAMASRCNGAGGVAAFTAIGQGTGATPATVADTTLGTGVSVSGVGDGGVHVLSTANVTVSRTTTSVPNDTAQLVGTIAENAIMAITESGVFNADTNGNMLCRQIFTAINVIAGDSLQLTWAIKCA